MARFNYTLEKQPAVPVNLPPPTTPTAPGEEEIRLSLENLASADLPRTMAILAGLLALQPLVEGLALREQWPSPWSMASLGGASLCGMAWLLAAVRKLPGRWSHPVAVFVAGAVLLFQFFAIYVSRQPWPALTISILLAGLGALMVRQDWFALMTGGAVLGWFCLPPVNLREPAWINFSIGFVSSVAIAWRIHFARSKTLARLQQLELEQGDHRQMLSDEIEKSRRAEQRFRAFTDAINEAIVVHKDGLIVEANPAAERLFSYNHGELAGKPVLALVMAEYAKLLDSALAWGQQGARELIGKGKDGAVLQLSVASNPAQIDFDQFTVTTFQDRSSSSKRKETGNSASALEIARKERGLALREAVGVAKTAGGLVQAGKLILPLADKGMPASLGSLLLLHQAARWIIAASTVSSLNAGEMLVKENQEPSFADWVKEQNEPLLLSDLNNDGFNAAPLFGEAKPLALAAAPVVYGGQTVAVLACLERAPRVYNGEDAAFLSGLASALSRNL